MGLLADLVERKVERQHSDEEDRKKKLREFYYDRIHDENTDPKVRDQITNDYLKLLSPEAKKAAQHGIGVIGKLKQAFGVGPKPAQQQAAQPQQPVGPPQYAPGAADKNPGIPTVTDPAKGGEAQPVSPVQKFNAGPGPAAAPAPASNFFQDYGKVSAQQKRDEEAYKSKLEQERQIAVEKAKPQATTARKQVRFKLADGTEVDTQWDPKAGTYFDNKNEPFEIPEGAQVVAAKTSSARPTILATDFVTLEDAQSLAENGVPFTGDDGKAVDLTKIPKGMVLQRIHYPDGKTVYQARNIADKIVNVGGHEYGVNPAKVQTIPQGGGTDLGVSKTTTARTGQTPVYNPDTREFEMFTTHGSSSPATPGAAGRPAPAQAPTVMRQGQQPSAAPAPAPASAPGGGTQAASPAAKPQAPAAAPTASMGRRIPAGQVNQVTNRSLPVQEAAVQLFGGNGVKGLSDYANLANNPDSVKRIGSALNLIFDGINDAAGSAHVNAEAGPVNFSTGGIGAVLQNYFGVPQELAKQKSQIMSQALQSLPPGEEREYVNAVIASYASAIGLRALSRASASQASTASIERELPILGVNTFDSDVYADKLQRLAGTLNQALEQTPRGSMTKEMEDRIKALPGITKGMKKGPAKAPDAKGKSTSKQDDPLDILK